MKTKNSSLLSQKTFVVFDSKSSQGTLAQCCRDLFEQQKANWLQMAEGYTTLRSVRVREIVCGDFSVQLQFNPKRIVSTSANTDPKAIQERTCFLCLEHLPEQQKGILYHKDYLILCNPRPIFSQHFTFTSIQHIPQEFESSVEVMLELTKDLSPDFTVFYNGPKCGASAPDHVHFQVSPRLGIPVERDAVDVRCRKRFYYKNHVAGFTLTNYGRAVVIVESTDKHQLIAFMKKLSVEWKKLLHLSEEPMMNVLCSYPQELWRFIIFPRRKHRPDVYFKEGSERVLVSPAAVDIGGLIVTPLEKDFLRIDAKLIEEIFVEVSEEQDVVGKILGLLQ